VYDGGPKSMHKPFINAFTFILTQWTNISSFIILKMIDDTNKEWSSTCGYDWCRVGAVDRIHYEGTLDPNGEFYHDGPINRVASASTSCGLRTCNRDICIFVNIIISW
jgi:hypothetical protein